MLLIMIIGLSMYGNLMMRGILLVNDIKASDVSPAIKTLYANSKTRMVISGLIKNGDDIIGIISMEHEKPYAYKAEEKEMLLTSIAIISTFLVKKYQEKEKNQYLNAIQMILDFQEMGFTLLIPTLINLCIIIIKSNIFLIR